MGCELVAHVPARKLPLAVRGESPSLGSRESVPDNGIWISSAAFARLPVVTSTQTDRARRHSKRSHLCWPQSASSRTWQGRRSYAFLWVRRTVNYSYYTRFITRPSTSSCHGECDILDSPLYVGVSHCFHPVRQMAIAYRQSAVVSRTVQRRQRELGSFTTESPGRDK